MEVWNAKDWQLLSASVTHNSAQSIAFGVRILTGQYAVKIVEEVIR